MLANLKIGRFRVVGLAFLALMMGFIGCNEDKPEPLEMAIHYFPILKGNSWTYQVDLINQEGEVLGTRIDTWTAGEGRLDIVSNEPVWSGGYRVMYIGSDSNIYTLNGEFLTTRYIREKNSQAYLLYIREGTVPFYHWMIGGKERINKEDYIYAKDSIALPNGSSDVRIYTFRKGVGITELKEIFYYSDQFGNYIEDGRRVHTLTGYQLR